VRQSNKGAHVVLGFAQDYDVNGVIPCIMKFCNSHEYGVPDLKGYLERNGFPLLPPEAIARWL
jgi:benzoyl-CoA reductase/2-hydroxyglutaryl-CoA dehydratase subunit BcrC/BadD/HgdB